MKERVHQLNMAGRVAFAGWVDDMESLWPEIDCLVHTAVREPFGRVIIEALAHLVPVIAVDSGGPSEILKDGSTGLLVKTAEARALAQAMSMVARAPRLREELARNGHRHVINHFTARATADHVDAVYRKATGTGDA